jgi:chromosome segregation ATPase
MSNVIAARDTVGIWEALNEPTDEVITQLRQEMTTLEETVRLMQNKIDAQDVKIHDLEGQVELNKNNIASHDRKIQHLESLVASYDGTFSALEARIYALEQRPLALVTYVEGKEFKTSQLTWKSYGQLYQCAKAFTASGDFNKDVGLGNLVPIAADSTDISAIEAELREVVETANDASSTATATAETVDAMSGAVSELQEQTSTLNDQVSTINGTLETIESDINTLQDDVNDLKFDKDSKTKVIITNTTTGERQLANSYGAAATIVKNAEDGSFTITCGDDYSQQTIAADTFKDATRLTEITFPASITTIASTAFDGCDGIIINIPKETDSVTGSPWGATNATVNWNE